jgi:type I restriction enzyme R subunit
VPLLNNELKLRSKKYLVQSKSFAEMLEATIRKYQNRTIEAAQVIAELIELAKQMREGQKRGESLGLSGTTHESEMVATVTIKRSG